MLEITCLQINLIGIKQLFLCLHVIPLLHRIHNLFLNKLHRIIINQHDSIIYPKVLKQIINFRIYNSIILPLHFCPKVCPSWLMNIILFIPLIFKKMFQVSLWIQRWQMRPMCAQKDHRQWRQWTFVSGEGFISRFPSVSPLWVLWMP